MIDTEALLVTHKGNVASPVEGVLYEPLWNSYIAQLFHFALHCVQSGTAQIRNNRIHPVDVVFKRYRQEIEHQGVFNGSIPSIMGAPETIDSWRHERMFDTVRSLIVARPDAAWLTIGDGGADAWMLRALGAKTVTASCISDVVLRRLAAMGYLAGIQISSINAESIDLPDRSVDFVFCKEAFHHFPRPPLAFYEFLRVSRIGFVMVEPLEPAASRPLDILRSTAKRVLRRRRAMFEQFEPVGNYIYRLSEREVFRMLTAIQVSWFALKPFSDFYIEWLSERSRNEFLPRLLFRLGLGMQNQMARFGLMNHGLCTMFVPACSDVTDIKNTLALGGFLISLTPRNPYLEENESTLVPPDQIPDSVPGG